MSQRRIRHFEKDTRSTSRLIEIAVSEFENEKAWNAIHVLRCRGTREVFKAAKQLCDSRKAKEREVGVNILAQIGAGKPVFLDQSVTLLIKHLHDSSIRVVNAAGVGLGHRNDAQAIPHLIALKDHSNPRVRFGVAFGLARHESPQAIQALIQLSKDKNRDVRDYATFGLAELIDRNTKAVRDALCARLKERDVEIRGQALIGLAKRKDRRVLKPLKNELIRRFHGIWSLEAAEFLCNPCLHPFLVRLRRRWRLPEDHYFTKQLNDAIAACQPNIKC